LAGAGGALGSVGSLFILEAVRRSVPSQVTIRDLVARGPEVGLDPAMLGFALAVLLGTALAFSVVPLLRPVSVAEELEAGLRRSRSVAVPGGRRRSARGCRSGPYAGPSRRGCP
jgi:hypothetical protein